MTNPTASAFRLDNKIALVTGGGTGIGKAIAHSFVQAGARVFIAGRNLERLTVAATDIGATPIAMDVTSEDAVLDGFARIVGDVGGLDVLVNNAGQPGPVANAQDMDMSAWDECMATNIRSTMLCIRSAIPLMTARGGGSIINMSSLMGLRGYPMRAAYSATKFAIIGMTEAIAHEVGVHNIRVNALCPGAVNGELMERVIARRAEAEDRPAAEIIAENYTNKAALRRWVEPEEVADAALFLASSASSSITGDRIKVDAGRI